ncbi:MAG: glycosyltransferase family 39 protein [Thermomicrobiales bacterium]
MSHPESPPPTSTGHRRDPWGWAGLAVLLLVGLAIRLALTPVEAFVYDRRAFTEWMIALQLRPLADFYHLPLHIPADHLPGTLWLLTALGTIASWMGVAGDRGIAGLTPQEAQPFLKALPILADLLVGSLIFAIVRSVAPDRRRAPLVAAAGWLLSPGVVFISAVWGQWDAISLVFVLAAILSALQARRGRASWTMAVPSLIALAMLMKPQFAILAPILGLFLLVPHAEGRLPRSVAEGRRMAWAIWRGAGWRLAIGGVIAVGIVTLAGWPFHVGLLPLDGWETYTERASFAANRFQGTTYGAVSLWLIPLGTHHPPHDSQHVWGSLSAAHLGWGLVAVSALAGIAVAHRHRWNATGLIAGCTVTYLGLALFATRMHERYLLPALALSLLLAGVRPAFGTILPAAALSLAYFASVYLSYTSYAVNEQLPLRDLRTGTMLSTLGAIGVTAFVVLLVSAWAAPNAPRASRRSRPVPMPNPPVDLRGGSQPVNAGG